MIVPGIINLELTNRCNLECVFCDHPILKRTMRKGEMSAELLRSLFDGLGGQPVYELGLVGLGEPTLDKDFGKHLEIIGEYKHLFTRISLNSNAVILGDKRIDEILASPINLVTFSLNATDKNGYIELMKFDKFDAAVANIRNFMQKRLDAGREDLKVSVQFMSSKLNAMEKMEALFAEFLTDDVIVYNRYVFHKPALDDAAEDVVNINNADFANRPPCWSMYSRVYVDIDGNVYPCTIGNDSYRESSALNLGNLGDSTVLEIFNNERIRVGREAAEKGEVPFPECEKCTLWALFPNNFHRDDDQWVLNSEMVGIRRPELDR